jgi:hypothetical protein
LSSKLEARSWKPENKNNAMASIKGQDQGARIPHLNTRSVKATNPPQNIFGKNLFKQ